MTSRFTAIVEQGRLRPTTAVDLPEGATVDVVVFAAGNEPTGTQAARVLAAIAALPSEPVAPDTSARHDDVLYGREAHP
jgi:hypothetical protein